MNNSFKHGDQVIAKAGRDKYDAHIEERFVTKSPSRKRSLFVVFDDTIRQPIPLNDFIKFYGTIEKQSNTE